MTVEREREKENETHALRMQALNNPTISVSAGIRDRLEFDPFASQRKYRVKGTGPSIVSVVAIAGVRAEQKKERKKNQTTDHFSMRTK